MASVTAVKHLNYGGSGMDWTFIHNPIYDGPIERYKNRTDCEVITLNLENEHDGLPKM